MSPLFAKTTLGSLTLQNHLVMAPLTRIGKGKVGITPITIQGVQ